MPLLSSTAIAGKTILWKIFLYSTGILLIIILLQSSIQSSKEKSMRPFISNFGNRILSADNYIYNTLQNLKENPDKIYYQAKYIKVQSELSSNPNLLQLKLNQLNSKWEKFKFYLAKTWVYIDLIFSIWFLITVFYLFYYLSSRFIVGYTDAILPNVFVASLIFIFFQITFTLMLYDHTKYNNQNFLDLPPTQQAFLLTPVKGLISLVTDFNYLIGNAYNKIVIPIENAKASNNTIESAVAKTFG